MSAHPTPQWREYGAPRSPALTLRWLGVLLGLVWAIALRAEVAAGAVITSAQELSHKPQDGPTEERPFQIKFLVTYYDPAWRVLWGENNGSGAWLSVRGKALPMRPGQEVVIEGRAVPGAVLNAEELKVTVVRDGVMPAPLDVVGDIADASRYHSQWVRVDGYVCRQREVDASHVQLEILCQGRILTANILLPSADPVPNFNDARVRVAFVYSANRDVTGQLQRITAWVRHPGDVQVIGALADDDRFRQARTPIDHIAATAPGESLRVSGRVSAYHPGSSVTVRDETGEIVVRTGQPLTVERGDMVEVVGRRAPVAAPTLSDPVCRLIPGHTDRGAAPSASIRLRLADQIMELSGAEAVEKKPVALRGVITWSNPKADFFFLQDSSSGVRVRFSPDHGPAPAAGTLVTVEGATTNGAFAPEVVAESVTPFGPTPLAVAPFVTLDQALTGAEEAKRIEMRGYVRQVRRGPLWTVLSLITSTGAFVVNVPPDAKVDALVGSIVRVTGVCAAITNERRQLTGITLWVSGLSSIRTELPKLEDPYSVAYRSVGSLRQYLGVRMFDRQVRLKGVVTYYRPGGYLYLQEENAGVVVLHRSTEILKPGDAIEVVGIPGRDGPRLVLRESVWRRTQATPAPVPLRIEQATGPDGDLDGRMVTMRGSVQDIVDDERDHRLMLRGNGVQFEARFDRTLQLSLPSIGSLVELTGVYIVEYDEMRRKRGFRLRLRGRDDIVVIKAAPWWTPRRGLAIAGGLGACALLGIGWVVVLRRRVEQQTAQIRTQLENQARLNTELERAARLESLGVLAGGIAHDFNNLLTVIMANLGLAAMDDRVRAAAGDVIAEAERGAKRAAELTQQLLTFAKGGDPVRRSVLLADVVTESGDFARHGSRVRCEYEFEPNLPPADVDPGQISRVVHNLVLNAIQAMPEGGVVRLGLRAVDVGSGHDLKIPAGRYVKLSVADNGPGIAAEHLVRIFEPYFSTKPSNHGLGLATVHSIVKKHQGQIRVRSEVGIGTTFEIWLPASKAPATATVSPAKLARPTTALRVLFMDDDPVIRKTAETVLKELGHSATLVADGAEVVREYGAALSAGRRFDVVVLDLTVPGGIGGRAAIEVLRRMDPAVRAIVSSGYSQDPVLANFQEYGFCAVVPKPYQVEDLARSITEVARMDPPGSLASQSPSAR